MPRALPFLRRSRTSGPIDPGDPPDPDRAGPRVLVLSAAVGEGHDGAARELARRLERRGVRTEVRDWTDALPVWGRRILRDLYAPSVHHTPRLFDWIFSCLERRSFIQWFTLSLCRISERTVVDWSEGADVVVATYPLAGQALGSLRRDGRLGVPALTFLTDPAAHRMWCHPGLDGHLTVSTATAHDGARYDVDLDVVGPLCAPRFARPLPAGTRDRVRTELGVPDGDPLVLLMAGSLGMGAVDETVAAVLVHPRAYAVVACGRNEGLRRRLDDLDRVVALGWRDDVPELMAAADLLIHNAGGLSCTEAMVAGLPVVTYRPIPGHGRANAAVLAAAGTAAWPTDAEQLAGAIDDAMADAASRRQRGNRRSWWFDDDASAVVARYAGVVSADSETLAG